MLAVFQSVHQQMSITGDITEDSYLYVQVVAILGTVGLLVYRSPIVSDFDPMYEPVRRTLEEHSHDVVIQETIQDSNMIFGTGEWSMYVLHPPRLEGAA